MKDEVLESLHDTLKKHVCKLRKVSEDTNGKEKMCDSVLKVVNFDKIPKEYAKTIKAPWIVSSNDALYISDDGQWYMIEFKNGTIDKLNLYRKIYDSIIMLMELEIIRDFHFARNNINYILVYNGDKSGKIQKSTAQQVIYAYGMERAKKEEVLFDIDKLEKYLLKETHTYTKENFQKKFIEPMEKREGLVK